MLSLEAKRAAAAKRSRDYRERKRNQAAAAAAPTAPPRDASRKGKGAADPATMAASVEQALGAMKWLQPSDGALMDMARLYASQIDKILREDPSATGKAASLGQLLTRILHELGGTPTVRMQHELRSLRLKVGADDDDEGSTTEPTKVGSNVTSIKRPPKRRTG